MRHTLLVLLIACVASAPASAGLDSGGGTRSGGGIQVQDALGLWVAGVATGDGVRMSTGLVFGIGIPVPVDLLAFHIGATPGGVSVTWTAPEDAGVAVFTLERAPGNPTDPDLVFASVAPLFHGGGPHSHTDIDLVPGATFSYRLVARLRSGDTEILGPWRVTHPQPDVALVARVLPARPNPFRGALTLAFELAEPVPVRWRLMDIQGALIAETDLGHHDRGAHAVSIRVPEDAARGIYFLEVVAGDQRNVQKVVRLP